MAVWYKKPPVLIYICVAVAVIALAVGVLSVTSISFRHSLANIPFVFLDGQEIEVAGDFACVPTTGIEICTLGFRDAEGNHYLLTNIEEIIMANPDLDSSSRLGAENKFHVTGVFSHGASASYSYVLVAGQINVASLTMVSDNTRFIVPE